MFPQKGETDNSSPAELNQPSARRRSMETTEMHQLNTDVSSSKRGQRQLHKGNNAPERHYEVSEKYAEGKSEGVLVFDEPAQGKGKGILVSDEPANNCSGEIENKPSPKALTFVPVNEWAVDNYYPRFGATYLCGRRRDMEDAVALHPWLTSGAHFYAVYDGHGCSHVAMKCRDRMHEIVKEEIEMRKEEIYPSWEETMKCSFSRVDIEAMNFCHDKESSQDCRCHLKTPNCYWVGSTAVVAIVTPNKIIVSNCGDSRAIICRNGVVTPLSSDQKPDREDELKRIEAAGGRVLHWGGARVQGVLAMSRAIGDSFLKPFVISEPEVMVIDRTAEDECLVLASDGLWDVVSNDIACRMASACLGKQKQKQPLSPLLSPKINTTAASESSDKACANASRMLTNFALGRNSLDNVSAVVVDLRREQHKVLNK